MSASIIPIPAAESSTVIRERFYDDTADSDLLALLREIRSSRATGQLILDINLGGVGSIRFREQHQVTFPGSSGK